MKYYGWISRPSNPIENIPLYFLYGLSGMGSKPPLMMKFYSVPSDYIQQKQTNRSWNGIHTHTQSDYTEVLYSAPNKLHQMPELFEIINR